VNIELTDLTRTFGHHTAVASVTLTAGPGVFGLLGPNGAGKTSLLRMLATVLPPSSGQLLLLDRDPARQAARREIRRRLGYLPQTLGYYPAFTVVEFIEYFALLKEMPAARVPQAVAAAVERVDLGVKARAKLRTLSGGMLRRVGIAQAIVNDPDLLLLDEPTAGLDPEQRVQFRTLLRHLGERSTVIVSTHLVEDVGAACSEVALMDAGRIVFRGTPDELTARGQDDGVGDAPLERGYTAVLAAARSLRAFGTVPDSQVHRLAGQLLQLGAEPVGLRAAVAEQDARPFGLNADPDDVHVPADRYSLHPGRGADPPAHQIADLLDAQRLDRHQIRTGGHPGVVGPAQVEVLGQQPVGHVPLGRLTGRLVRPGGFLGQLDVHVRVQEHPQRHRRLARMGPGDDRPAGHRVLLPGRGHPRPDLLLERAVVSHAMSLTATLSRAPVAWLNGD
jgi:ABC-2 type transport system ATP-binding protein